LSFYSSFATPSQGTKNMNLHKLIATITFEENQSLEERISQYTGTFVKYKKFLEEAVQEYR
jgi:hypothetical protein